MDINMDTVLSRLDSTTISPAEPVSNGGYFNAMYKNMARVGSQEERRRDMLKRHKKNRSENHNYYRGILGLVEVVADKDVFKDCQKPYYKPTIYVAGFNKAPTYAEVLMMSEWLTERPYDFEINWLVVPSPRATRTLVVANNGSTKLFTKYGHLMLECSTGLPGGHTGGPKQKSNCCVLDCFYKKKTKTLYVLDLLVWNSQPMTDGEFEFRDFWMRSHLDSITNIGSISRTNDLILELLPKVSCASDTLLNFLSKVHFKNDVMALDGFLFYHKYAHYVPGETPLVGWLYPFMVPEILGNEISVNLAYMIQKPVNYTNQAAFIAEFNYKLTMKNKTKEAVVNKYSKNHLDISD